MASSGMNVRLDAGNGVMRLKAAFDEFGVKAFGRAVQFSLNRTVIDGTNNLRDDILSLYLQNVSRFIKDGFRYELDKSRLASVASVDDVQAASFIMPMQSSWLKYSLGEEVRKLGDVGIEGFFEDQSKLYLPHEEGLAAIGITPNGRGLYSGKDIRKVSGALARGISVSGGARFGGAFEIRPGDRDPARLGIGIHARPMRGVASVVRERVRAKVRGGKMPMPTTTFKNAAGRSRTVHKVVNIGVP